MSPLFLLLCTLYMQVAVARHPKNKRNAKRPKRDVKIYMYNLRKKFKADTIVNFLENYQDQHWNRSNCDWNRNVCKETEWHGEYSTQRQYGADVTLIEKFKHYDNLVTDPKDADIFLVPYPHSSHCHAPRKKTRKKNKKVHPWKYCGALESDVVQTLIDSLTYLNNETKFAHLFLLTGDWSSNSPLLEQMPLYTTIGGIPNFYGHHPPPSDVTNIVIPPPVLEPEYQPSVLAKTNWTRQRKYSLYMNAGLVTKERIEVDKILNEVHSVGGLPTYNTKIEKHRNFKLSPSQVWANYRNTVFCPVIKGDLPYQKRFYDVILSGCLPVVLASRSDNHDETGCSSWYAEGKPNYVTTHAFARGGRTRHLGTSIDYREFVVEVFGGTKNIIPTLNAIMENKAKLHAMQNALGRHAHKLVYGLGDDMDAKGDAFDQLLGRLRHYLDHEVKQKVYCF